MQPVALRGLLARDGGPREITGLRDLLGGERRVLGHLDVAIAEAIEEGAALRERLRMRRHAPDEPQRYRLDGDQAVVYPVHFLADDAQFGLKQDVVGAIDPPGRRVLDGQHRVVGLLPGDGVGRIPEGRVAVVAHRSGRGGEVVARRSMAVAPIHTLIRHDERGRLRGLLARGLIAHRMVEDVPVEAGHEIAVEPFRFSELMEPVEHVALTGGIAQGRRLRLGFEGGHIGDEALALSERFDEATVDAVELVAEGLEIGHQGWK